MSFHLNALEVFITVVETKGFRAAGARLGVSGAAVSQGLRRFEDRLGVTLLQRSTRRVQLTEAGEQLYAAAKPAVEELRAALAAVRERGEGSLPRPRTGR